MQVRSPLTALVAAMILAAPVAAQSPEGTACTLPANSFGGSGIPTNQTMCSVFGAVTLGLSATQRYTSPAVTWNGMGVFYAALGNSTGAPTPPGNIGFAAWNVDYAVRGATTDQFFSLFVDLDPTLATSFFRVDFAGNRHDSSNLHYFSPIFDNTVDGEYTFRLEQYSTASRTNVVSAADIEVITGRGAPAVAAAPEPATVWLLAIGFSVLLVVARRRHEVDRD